MSESEATMEQLEHHLDSGGEVEFGEVFVGGFFGGFWGKCKGIFKKMFMGVAKSDMVKDALNSYIPGSGTAFQSGVKLIDSGKKGNPAAIAQIKAISDAAKAGDKAKQGAHDMLKAINEARNEVSLSAVVGKDWVVKLPNGKTRKFKSKAERDKFVQQLRQKSQQAMRQAGQRRSGQQPVTQDQVAQTMQRVPAGARGALASSIQQAQARGYAPVQPAGAPPYGTPGWYAWQQQNQGYPYGMQQGAPYGYGAPPMMQNPYGGMYADDSFLEQSDYYGNPDEELAAAFAGDESFPDEAMQGEPSITFRG